MAQTFGEMYDDWLDGLHDVGSYNFGAMLKDHDPIAYGCGFGDFLDDFERFRCAHCNAPLEENDVWSHDETDTPTCKECAEVEVAEGRIA